MLQVNSLKHEKHHLPILHISGTVTFDALQTPSNNFWPHTDQVPPAIHSFYISNESP